MGQGTRRRRYLTIVFSDLSASTELSSKMEAEDYADMLNQIRLIHENTTASFGGQIFEVHGDATLIAFGHPAPREDDLRQALELSLSLCQKASKVQFPVSGILQPMDIHIGVHSGLLLVHESPDKSAPPQIFGEAINVAARLSDAAGPGDLLVSREALGRDQKYFETGPSRALNLAGLERALDAIPITGISPPEILPSTGERNAQSPFVGRQSELSALTQAFEDSQAKSVNVVEIVAPAGIGKTRLAEQFLKTLEANGTPVHRGLCEDLLSAEPYQPFLQILRSDFTDVALNALSAPKQTPEKFADFLVHHFQSGPRVIFIDDWHWVDDATYQVITSLMRRVDCTFWFLLCARPKELNARQAPASTRIDLPALEDSESLELINHFIPGGDQFTSAQILNFTGNYPLYIEEMCRAGLPNVSSELAAGLAGEVWLQRAIEYRLEHLPHHLAGLARSLSIVGQVVPFWLIESLTGYPHNHVIFQELAQNDIIYGFSQNNAYRFKHGIVRVVIYNTVSPDERRRLHTRVAEIVMQKDEEDAAVPKSELLAHHCFQGGLLEQALDNAELAGDKALALSALDRAKAQFEMALQILSQRDMAQDQLDRYFKIVQRLALASVFDPEPKHLEIVKTAQSLIEQTGKVQLKGRIFYWAGFLNYSMGRHDIARSALSQALNYAQDTGDAIGIVQASATLGQCAAAMGEYPTALDLLNPSIKNMRPEKHSHLARVGLAYSLACKGAVLGDMGRFSLADECFQEAAHAIHDLNHEVEASVLCWQCAVELWQGNWAAANATARKADDVSTRVKSIFLSSMAQGQLEYSNWKLGKLRTGWEERFEHYQFWRQKGDRSLFGSLIQGWSADIFSMSGKERETRRQCARAFWSVRAKDKLGAAMASRALARLALGRQDFKSAERYLEQAIGFGQDRISPHENAVTNLDKSRLALALGHRSDAVAYLEAAQETFHRLEMTAYNSRISELSAGL